MEILEVLISQKSKTKKKFCFNNKPSGVKNMTVNWI